MYLPRILLFIILAMILTTISKIGSDPRILLMVIDLISGIIVILLLNALIADITDIDEKNAECRREAIYFWDTRTYNKEYSRSCRGILIYPIRKFRILHRQ